MIPIQLDPAKEQRLRKIAASLGQDTSELARHVLEDYLDAHSWEHDRDEDWADASMVMTPEVLADEEWEDDAGHGSR